MAMRVASTLVFVALMVVRAPTHASDDAAGDDAATEDDALGGDERADTRIVRITVTGDTAETVIVTEGDSVRLEIVANTPMDLHLHGYDLTSRAGPDGAAIFVFKASANGRFAIVAHEADELLGREERARAYLEVHPE